MYGRCGGYGRYRGRGNASDDPTLRANPSRKIRRRVPLGYRPHHTPSCASVGNSSINPWDTDQDAGDAKVGYTPQGVLNIPPPITSGYSPAVLMSHPVGDHLVGHLQEIRAASKNLGARSTSTEACFLSGGRSPVLFARPVTRVRARLSPTAVTPYYRRASPTSPARCGMEVLSFSVGSPTRLSAVRRTLTSMPRTHAGEARRGRGKSFGGDDHADDDSLTDSCRCIRCLPQGGPT